MRQLSQVGWIQKVSLNQECGAVVLSTQKEILVFLIILIF